MLILLASACLIWVGILSLAFMVFTGTGISAAWIFGGALVIAIGIWIALLNREIRQALESSESSEIEGRRSLDSSVTRSVRPRTISPNPRDFTMTGKITPSGRRGYLIGKTRSRRDQRANRSLAR